MSDPGLKPESEQPSTAGSGAAQTPAADPSLRWRRTEELFHQAMDLAPSERLAKLAEWCGADTALRDSVLALLEADGCVEELISAHPLSDSEDFLLKRPGSDSTGAPNEARFTEETEEDVWVGRVLGAFRLQRLLGRGGMGVVYLGERVSGGFRQQVAVKLVGRHLRSSPAVAQFLMERETLAGLEHAHIARLLDGGVTGEGFPYVVMEYVEGRRLDEAADDPSTTIEQIIRWMLQLCDAVTYVHRNLILHRDLKPGNVMVTSGGAVKLLDFGTLKRIGPAGDTDSEMTRAGIRPVTVRYASPEHIQGGAVSTAADVYSLGMILYRLIAGRLPEDLDDLPIGQYLEHLKAERFRPPSQVAAQAAGGRVLEESMASDLDAIVGKALRHDAGDRYPTAGALATDLWNVLLHRPVTAREGGLRYRAVKFYRRYRWPILVSAVAAVVLVAGLSAMAWQGHLARLEQLRAEKGVEDERKLAHMLLFDYFEQLSLIPGSIDAQRRAVIQAMSYLDGLARIAPGSNLEMETITGYTDMGNLLGNPYKQNLGKVPEAIESLSKALTVAEARVQRKPNDLDSLKALLVAQYSLGETYLGNGNAVRAEQIMLRAADVSATIAHNPHADGEMLLEASSALDILGDVYDPGRGFTTADMNKAMRNYLLSSDYEDMCRKVDPGNESCQSGVVVGEYKFGSLVEDSDPELAASHYRKGLDVVSHFSAELMKTTRSHRLKNYMLCRLGLMQIRTGHMDEGQALAHQAQDGFREAIAKAELDNRARFDMVAFETDLAGEYDRFGKEQDASETAREVLGILSVLLQRSPNNTRWKMIEAEDWMTFGRVETKLGHRKAGQEASKKGLEEAVSLAKEKDASPEALDIAADGLLELHMQSHDAELALSFAQRAAGTYARPTAAQLLTLAKAQHAAGYTKDANKNAQLVLAALAGPVKSPVIAEEIAGARRVLR